jgi:uncharacterized membrane protein YdjX (TVP38/TMEM64 family)
MRLLICRLSHRRGRDLRCWLFSRTGPCPPDHGPKWQDVERKIDQAGVIAVATMRLLPVAPFTVVNVVSGAFQVPLWPYFLGSLLGMAPGIILINLFAHEIEIAIENPGAGGFILLGALIVISVLATLWLRLQSGKDKAEKKISV